MPRAASRSARSDSKYFVMVAVKVIRPVTQRA
jgi:hypothetical protein